MKITICELPRTISLLNAGMKTPRYDNRSFYGIWNLCTPSQVKKSYIRWFMTNKQDRIFRSCYSTGYPSCDFDKIPIVSSESLDSFKNFQWSKFGKCIVPDSCVPDYWDDDTVEEALQRPRIEAEQTIDWVKAARANGVDACIGKILRDNDEDTALMLLSNSSLGAQMDESQNCGQTSEPFICKDDVIERVEENDFSPMIALYEELETKISGDLLKTRFLRCFYVWLSRNSDISCRLDQFARMCFQYSLTTQDTLDMLLFTFFENTHFPFISPEKETGCCSYRCLNRIYATFPGMPCEVDGLACETCMNFNYCKCFCLSFIRSPEEEKYSPPLSAQMSEETKRSELKKKLKSKQQQKKFENFIKQKQYLLRQLEKNKSKRKKLQAEMFEPVKSLYNLPTVTSNTLTSVGDVSNMFKDVGHSIKELVDKLIEMITPLITIPHTLNVFVLIATLHSLVTHCRNRDWSNIITCLAVVATQFNIPWDSLTHSIQALFSNISEDLSVNSMQAQALEVDSTFLKVLGALLISFFGILFTGKDSTGTFYLKWLSDFGRAAVGWTRVTDMFCWIKNFVMDLYYRKVLGKTLEQVEIEDKYPMLERYCKQVDMLLSPNFSTGMLDVSETLCRKVIELDKELDNLRAMAIRVGDKKLAAILTLQISRILKIVEYSRRSCAKLFKKRVPPFMLYIYGKSGVGKSLFVQYLVAHVYKKLYENDEKWDMNNIAFTRHVENEFWDGILPGQPIVIYDDILQSVDSKTTPNPEFLEIIRAKNDTPYHLHMSDITDKKNTFFNAAFVFATSNTRIPEPQSIKEKTAFTRRWDIAIEINVKSEFADSTGKIDPQKTPGGFSPDAYEIKLYDMENGSTAPIVHSMQTFVDLFDTHYSKNADHSQAMLKSICTQVGIPAPGKDTTTSAFITDFTAQMDEESSERDDECSERDFSSLPCDEDRDTEFESGEPQPGPSSDSDLPREHVDNSDFELEVNKAYDKFMEHKPEIISAYGIDVWGKVEKGIFRLKTVKKMTPIAKPTEEEDEAVLDEILSDEKQSKFSYVVSSITRKISDFCKMSIKTIKTVAKGMSSMAHFVFKFICSPYYLSFFAIMGLSLGCSMFSSCKLQRVSTFDDCAYFTCSCSHCSRFVSSQPIGTPAYALDVLRFMCLQEDLSYENFMLLRTYPFLMQDASAQSREIKTHTTTPKMRAEMRKAEADVIDDVNVYENRKGKTVLKAQMNDLNQREMWESVTRKNMVLCESESNHSVCGFFICGRILCVVAHFVNRLKQLNLKGFWVRKFSQDRTWVEFSRANVTACTDASGTVMDMVMIDCPDEAARPSLLSKMATANSIPDISYGEIVVSGIRKMPMPAVFTFCGSKGVAIPQSYSDTTGKNWKFNKLIRYELGTSVGDCGALVYVKNPLMKGKIVGMHVCGDNGVGAALPISRECMERNLKEHLKTSENPRRMAIDAVVPFQAQMRSPVPEDEFPKNSLAKIGNCISLGKYPTPQTSTKTSLGPSLICGTLCDPTTKPAHLNTFKIGGEEIDPMRKGILKVLNTQKTIDMDILEACTEHVRARILENRESPRNFSFEEAITGTQQQYITPINRTTSPGYPYNLDNKEPGKRAWLGYDDFQFPLELRDDVDKIFDNCRQNKRSDVIWTATLKDERRPIEKVEAGKTRVFAAGPMHYTIAVRMMFLDFVAHIMKNRINNGIGVGTNPYGMDWHRTGVALSRMGPYVIAGDFSQFDGSLLQPVLWKVCEIINAYYDDGEENMQIREVLFEEILNANILVQGELIRCDHSQPSGNPLTVIINSIFNHIVMRYAYVLCMEQAGEIATFKTFDNCVEVQAFGDDNVLNIANTLLGIYNQETISIALETIGLVYTDEAKSGEIVPYRRLGEIKYLKRSFVIDECGYYVGPLDIDVCDEMTNWVRDKTLRKSEATIVNCNAALLEFCVHGKLVFKEKRKKLMKALAAHQIHSCLLTWREARSIIKSDIDPHDVY